MATASLTGGIVLTASVLCVSSVATHRRFAMATASLAGGTVLTASVTTTAFLIVTLSMSNYATA